MGSMQLSRRGSVPPFQVMSILRRVGELRAQGRDVISLCAGEPSGGAAPAVNEAAAAAHASGESLNYTPAAGLPELREAIAGHYRRWYGTEVDPGEVVVTTGASGAFVLAFLAAFEAGDAVAIARPGYPAYRNILTALGLRVVEIPCGPETRYQPTPELLDAARQEHGRLAGLILASPANPTGTMVSRPELEALTRWCARNDARLISDEIYHGITYPEPGAPDPLGVSARELGRDAVVVSSFSKFWGMPGWRVGWLLAPPELAGGIEALAGNVALCPPAAAQRAAVRAFDEEAYAFGEAQLAQFARTRAALLARLPELGWGEAAPADGAFYLYARLGPALGSFTDAAAWCAALLEEEGVALTPGSDFDGVLGGGAVRLSFAAGAEAVQAAVERILAFQARHAPERGA
ncbi:MAG: aminotransferase class I/II-fold pyridoxal phosphate-dependent enzyme [Arthrobacter sp.]|nr:aminotransferase class I/II-fold pyridoxal phosphate-dependent enzyme [Arthrobacter sp.]